MKCKHCGANLPEDAKYCDVCGKAVERSTYAQREKANAAGRAKDKKKQRLTLAIAIASVILAGVAIWYFFFPKMLSFNPDLYDMKVKVSEDELQKISIGMTYKEICDVVGGKGKLSQVFGSSTDGSRYYAWPGEYMDRNVLYADLTISFDNKTKKADYIKADNILEGSTLHENNSRQDHKTIAFKGNERPEIKDGMSYEEVVSLLGAEGILTDTNMIKRISDDDTYTAQYYWLLENEETFWTDSIYVWFKNGRVDGYDRLQN